MLDFAQVTNQIRQFAVEQARLLPDRRSALAEAERRLRAAAPDYPATQQRIDLSRTSWLVANLLESPDATFDAPERPAQCVVLAADGSQLVGERHDVALCYLLNIGLIALRYGTGERATLASRPLLSSVEEALLDEFQGDQAAIAPRRLSLRRALAEFAGLIELMEFGETAQKPALPTLALYDGSLILWQLESETEEFRRAVLGEYELYLEQARQKRIPIAGYISLPQSRDVVNALRVFVCPHREAYCDQNCPNRSKPKPQFVAPDCAGTERITDAEVFAGRLQPGQRSALFGSRSKILKEYSARHRTVCFYLHTGREVARIEIPEWVARDPELLERTHALCYDQAQKGDGYPVALAEAHEQAIIRNPERDAFFQLLENRFVQLSLPVAKTQKALSKRARRV
jgi:hypothetical protein